MSEKKPYYYARTKAILSLQFYRDKNGTPNFLITSNPQKDGEFAFTGIDRMIFADNLIRGNHLSERELLFLCAFFETVKERIKAGVTSEMKDEGDLSAKPAPEFVFLAAVGHGEDLSPEDAARIKAFIEGRQP